MNDVLVYFEDTYIGMFRRNAQRRPPLIPDRFVEYVQPRRFGSTEQMKSSLAQTTVSNVGIVGSNKMLYMFNVVCASRLTICIIALVS